MDDRRAALLLAGLALAGAGVRYALAPTPAAAPGEVRLAARDTPPPSRLRETARTAARLARPGATGGRAHRPRSRRRDGDHAAAAGGSGARAADRSVARPTRPVWQSRAVRQRPRGRPAPRRESASLRVVFRSDTVAALTSLRRLLC